MAALNFKIWGTPQITTALVQKDYTDPAWPVANWPDTYAEMRYWESGPTFDYWLKGYGLQPSTWYYLIYYADLWPGNNPGGKLGVALTDANGYLEMAYSLNLGYDLPHPDDDNYGTCAKVWIVPMSDYDADISSMIAWNPGNYLFEYQMVDYEYI